MRSRTHFINMRECERGYLGGSTTRVVPPRMAPLASGTTQQHIQIASSLRVLTKSGAGRVALLAHRSLCDASHALPAPLLVRTHLTPTYEMSSHFCSRHNAERTKAYIDVLAILQKQAARGTALGGPGQTVKKPKNQDKSCRCAC